MFKSIEYTLITYLFLLMTSLVGGTYCFISGAMVCGVLCVVVVFISLSGLRRNYKKYNRNILFLLNAMENGDYSFHFSTNKLSRREKELNQMLNRIKEVLVKARREIVENEEFLSIIVESVSTGILIVDEADFVRNVNQSAVDLLGLNSLSHLNQLQHIDESFPDLFRNLKPGENPPIHLKNELEEVQLSIRMSGILISGKPFKVITLSNIGSELEAKEMESWIRLIRVMTHEIMNSIAPITSLSEAILFSLRSHSVEKTEDTLYQNTMDALETIHGTTKGLLHFVESYRQFTRIPKPQLAPVDLNKLLQKVVLLKDGVLNEKNIPVKVILPTENVWVHADESQISQILVNILKNAIEAIDKEPSTSIEESAIEVEVISASGQATIEIRNNGTLIPQEVLPHIFIPFFTTKEEGSGIGLSLSRYMMRLHSGNLKHHTSGPWTIFSLVFPASSTTTLLH